MLDKYRCQIIVYTENYHNFHAKSVNSYKNKFSILVLMENLIGELNIRNYDYTIIYSIIRFGYSSIHLFIHDSSNKYLFVYQRMPQKIILNYISIENVNKNRNWLWYFKVNVVITRHKSTSILFLVRPVCAVLNRTRTNCL